MSVQETKLKAIADAIREKDGTTDPIPASSFPERIRAIPEGGMPEDVFTILVTTDNPEAGSVTGGGVLSKTLHAKCSAIATPAEGWNFAGWLENGETVWTAPSYEFDVNRDRNLVAAFSEKPVEYSIDVNLSCGSLGVGKIFNTYGVLTVGGKNVTPGASLTATSYTMNIVTTQNPVEVTYRVTTTKFVTKLYVYVNGTVIGNVQASGSSASTAVAPQDTITVKVI